MPAEAMEATTTIIPAAAAGSPVAWLQCLHPKRAPGKALTLLPVLPSSTRRTEKKGTLVSTSSPALEIQEHCVTWRKGKPFLEHLNITED